MDWKGKINFEKAITLNNKPHGVESEATLPTFDSGKDPGRVVYTEDTGKLWSGGLTEWKELTPGGVGEHYHDDDYYREYEIDAFFEGETGEGKKQVDWSSITTKPSTFTPSIHDNTAHSETYLVENDVTFTLLTNNNIVGTSSTQVAQGDHNHDTEYLALGGPATSVSYTNDGSLLSADNVQDAIDELDGRIDYSDNRISKLYWVDNTRTDSYNELGNIARPYKTITGAINAINSTGGEGTILLSQSTYDTTTEGFSNLTISENITLKALGNAVLNIPVTIGLGDTLLASGSNLIENIIFKQPITVQMNGSTKFTNVSIEDAGNVTVTMGSIEGDMSINNTSGDVALTLTDNANEFVGDNCSFSTSTSNTIFQDAGYLILSNSDIVNTTTAGINSTGGVLNISDTRVFNSGGGDAILIDNASTLSNPNLLMNLYIEGNVDTASSPTYINSITGSGTIQGSAQRYASSSFINYSSDNSDLNATTVQSAIDELANSHSESQLTTTIYVDASRTYDAFDEVGAKGTIDRPFINIDDAIAAASSGDTIYCFKGAYSSSGTISLPNNVNLIGVGQGKTNFYSPIETGSSGKCRLEHLSIRDASLTINETTFVNYVYSNSPVTINAPTQGEGFTIEVDAGPALAMNTSGDVTLTLNTISTSGDASAIVMPLTNTGALYLQTSRVENYSATLPTIDSDSGSVALITTTLVNNNGGPIANLQNSATTNSPNMLSQVFHSGGEGAIDSGASPTIVEGVHGGDPVGAIAFRPSTQIAYDPTDSGLASNTVKEALDEIAGSLGTGNAVDIAYTGTLDSTNVAGALDELDAEKSNIGHNHNDIYYTQTQTDSNFISRVELSDVVTHPLSSAYQEVELSSVSSGDESGLTAGSNYNFNITIDGTTNERTITPEEATAGYQELGLTGITSGTDTSLAVGTYDYQVKPNDLTFATYEIVIDPASPAEVVGTSDLSSGHDWQNYNADFIINVNGTEATINFTTNYSVIDDIINEINTQIPAGAEAFNNGSDYLGIRTTATGSLQTFTLTTGTNDALSTLGLTADTYSGTDAINASQDINLGGTATDVDESGLTTGTTYDVGITVDGASSTVNVSFDEATQAYQELGLTGIDSSTNTSLAEGTTYYFQLNSTEYSIITETSVVAENEITEIVFTDDTANSNAAYDGVYFDIYDLTTPYRVWFDLGNASTGPTAPSGGSLVEVDITTTNTVDEIVTATSVALEAAGPFSGDTSVSGQLTVTHTNAGTTTDALAQTAPVSITITTQGSDGDPADLTWGNIITQLESATTGFSWSIVSGDVRCTDNDLGSAGLVELAAGITTPDFFTAVSAPLEASVDGTDAESTTFSSLITKLNGNTTGATWSLVSGNIRLTSDTLGASGSISLSQGTTNDMVDSLNGIVTTDRFINTINGQDAQPASHVGSAILTDGYNFTNYNENLVITYGGVDTTYTLDITTTTLTEVVNLINSKLISELEAFESSPNVGLRTTAAGSSESFTTGTNGASSTLGIPTGTTFSGIDKTDTTWSNIIDMLNASTTANVTWTIEGDDIRCTHNTTGTSSKVALQAGTSNDFFTAVSAPLEASIDGTAATTKFSDIVNHLNDATLGGATWSFESGNLRVTRDESGSTYSVEISSGSTSDVFTNLNGFQQITSPVEGKDSDTTTGSDLVGVQGIADVQPTGKSIGEAGTLQEVLEGGIGQLRTAAPTSPTPGLAYFDASANTLYIYNGTAWVSTTLS